MHLRRIELRDFKVYEHIVLDFPAPQAAKNVILIGGLNGFGKTSLFEAIALGLYGPDALPIVNRARPGSDEDDRRVSYRNFMKGVLHRPAFAAGRRSASVTLTFEDERRQTTKLLRIWHFNDNGELRPNPDELRITTGLSNRPVEPPKDEPRPEIWYRDWIYRTFLPINQAAFFLFDGEAASVYAEREMATQIKDSIEGLLGLSWLRRLANDLKEYADHRRTEIPRGSNDDIIRLRGEVASLEKVIKDWRMRLDNLNRELADAERARDTLVRELSGYGPGTQAELQELIERRKECEDGYRKAQDDLDALAEKDLCFALVGADLRRAVIDRLRREERREKWLAAREESRSRIEDVRRQIECGLDAVRPPLDALQREGVKEAIEAGLDRFWNPPPPDVPDQVWHGHASGNMKLHVRRKLEAASSVTVETIKQFLAKMHDASSRIRELERQIDSIKLSGPKVEEKRNKLRELISKIDSINHEKGQLESQLQSKDAELGQKTAELHRLTGRIDASQPHLRRAARADKIRVMLENVIEEGWRLQANAIAREMTRYIREMAHKSDHFNAVVIDDGGDLRLLNQYGHDVRELDLSAGEKQIFTQALFAAVAKVSGRTFPLILDTPLGRLDEDHRLNVLRSLAGRDGQVVLISTNTEVVGSYLEAIRQKVSRAYLLDSQPAGEFRVTRVRRGYFPSEGSFDELE